MSEQKHTPGPLAVRIAEHLRDMDRAHGHPASITVKALAVEAFIAPIVDALFRWDSIRVHREIREPLRNLFAEHERASFDELMDMSQAAIRKARGEAVPNV